MAETNIEWVKNADGSQGRTWNPIRGCTRVSPGCGGPGPHGGCYAEVIAARFSGPGLPYHGIAEMRGGKARWTGRLAFVEEKLTEPLKVRKPTTWFVNSMSDLFHESVPDEWIDRVFAVMALCPQHTFQVLTKRSARMRSYCNDPGTPHRVAKAMDALTSAATPVTEERVAAIDGFPGYFVTDRGRVLSDRGSAQCVHCGQPVERTARARYCSKQCRQNAQYRLRSRKPMLFPATLAEMSPDIGEDGHRRVMLYRDGQTVRELVHRLVLAAFERVAADGEQGRHRDGDPSNNALGNLLWGDQPANWDDRRRHGAFRSYTKLTQEQAAEIKRRFHAGETGAALGREFGISDTQARNIGEGRQWAVAAPIQWPLLNCWMGVSAEDQRRADERVPDLLATPAAVRFVSAEPLLGPIDFTNLGQETNRFEDDRQDALRGWVYDEDPQDGSAHGITPGYGRLDWIIVGGESGPGARPMHPDWARQIRDACAAAGVAYLFKQWGAFAPEGRNAERWLWRPDGSCGPDPLPEGLSRHAKNGFSVSYRVGKKQAGRLLDGRTWDEMPGGVA